MKLYAYITPDIPKNTGYLKIGETTGDVEKRVNQQIHEQNLEKNIVWQDAVITERSGIDKMLHRYLKEQGFHVQQFTESGKDTELVKCTVADVEKAFAIIKEQLYQSEVARQAVSNEFYIKIRNWYYWTTGTNSKIDSEFALRLIVRLLFCYFLSEKGLVPKELFDEHFTQKHLKEDEEWGYYNAVLRNLFFHCLNTPMLERRNIKIEYENLIQNVRAVKEQFAKIPFLNGGLFNEHEGDDVLLNDDYFFSKKRERQIPELGGKHDVWGIIRILSQYEYKLSLDDLLDHADYAQTIDPEFIGKVFESLLACIDADSKETRRKVTGSYYTPQEIVDYMVNESLDAYRENHDDLLQCKILDPACGSGAFPCGIMNEIMRRLDQQKTLTSSERYRKKLKIIQEVIYGVDIQSIAVQITQLRLFLSLIQEIVPDKRKDNYGIEPLPNLETKFVCADALIGLKKKEKNGQGTLELPKIKEKIKQLQRTRSEYFTARTIREKEACRREDESLRKMLGILMEEAGALTHSTAEKLTTWNPYNPSHSASFFDSVWMFGVEKFDIVIGNPPYLKAEYFTKKQKEKYYKEFRFYADLYVYFIFAGFNLVRDGETLSFIANDSFLGFKNTENVRKLFFENDLRLIVQCDMIFENADIYTAIFLLQKQKNKTPYYETGRYDKATNKFLEKGKVDYSLSQNLVHHRLVVNSPIVTLYNKLLSNGKMRNICSVLDTGIHTGNCRSKLLFLKREKSNLEKVLQGKQISRYAFDWDSPRAKYKYCDIRYIPKKEKGIGRGGKQSKAKEYWHFCGDASNHRVDEKILLRQTDDDLIACYINREKDGLFYTDNTLFTVLPKKEYHIFFVLGLLNSRLLNGLYHFLSQEQGKSLAQVKTQVVEFLPVPLVKREHQQPIIDLVTRRLNGELVDDKIDALVYELYGLTKAEIAILEG